MKKWSQFIPNTPIDDNAIKQALIELASSAIATKKAIEQDLPMEGILSEITRMNNLLGLVKSGCSVKVLSQMMPMEIGKEPFLKK